MDQLTLFRGLAILAALAAAVFAGAYIRSRKTFRTQFRSSVLPGDTGTVLLERISKQLESLDDIGRRVEGLDRAFRLPRLRGGFGESLLEELLDAWLPRGSWKAQYSFPDGSRADAVIRMGSRLVAVDSKFPLESLESWLVSDNTAIPGDARRIFLSHAESIASKYVRPEDGTLSFALMYMPAENIHYRLLRDDDGSVMRECLAKHVLPVGPMSLFAYLQTVSYGLKGLALPVEGEELRRRVDRLKRDFEALAKPLSTASTHLKNLNGSWTELEKRLGRMEDGIEALETSSESSQNRK